MWGKNDHGQVGNGSNVNKSKPIKIANGIKQVNLGTSYTVAVDESDKLYMWGNNSSGQIGDGTTSDKWSPVFVSSNTIEAMAGHHHAKLYSIILKKDGSVLTCGANCCGELGNGTYQNSTRFQTITIPSTKLLNSSSNKSVQSVGALETKTATFSNCKPFEVYNFYSVKAEIVNDTLMSNNLLYIKQACADEYGNLSIEYIPTDDYANPYEFIVGINSIDISNVSVESLEVEYDGNEKDYTPIITDSDSLLVQNQDYLIQSVSSFTNAGVYAITIQGIGNYVGSREELFVISPIELSKSGDCQNVRNHFYTGDEITPLPILSSKGNVLTKDIDYSVGYDNNIEIGTANITINGIGNYRGNFTITFEIVEKKIGDTNIDGYINIKDVTAIQRHLCELETLYENGLAVADTNGDDFLDIADATHLQMYLAEYDVVLGKA